MADVRTVDLEQVAAIVGLGALVGLDPDVCGDATYARFLRVGVELLEEALAAGMAEGRSRAREELAVDEGFAAEVLRRVSDRALAELESQQRPATDFERAATAGAFEVPGPARSAFSPARADPAADGERAAREDARGSRS